MMSLLVVPLHPQYFWFAGLKTSSLSDLRTVACSYMQWAAFSMQHNASQTADELQNENDGLAGAIQVPY